MTAATPATDTTCHPWYALWTQSHCEQLVHDQLTQKRLDVFLPKVDTWSKRRGVRHLVQKPLFPGYLFIRDALDRQTHLDVLKTRGVVRVLGERWDRLCTIPDDEMRSIEHVVTSRQTVHPFPYVREGQRARVIAGPLTGLEGILVKSRPQQGLLVLSVHLLRRSVAVTIDCTDAEPV
jgi:transcription antitermination factor NusG